MNSSETSEFQEYIMDLEPKIKKTNLPSLTAASATPQHHATEKKLSAALLSEVAGANSSPRIWSWYVGTAEKISHTDFCFYKNENVLEKGNSFPKRWWWGSVGHPCEIFRIIFFRSLYQKSAGKGHHIRWAPGNGRDVGRVGQFTPSDALAKTKAISAYDMCVFIGWDWWVFLDPRRFILAIHSESPMQRLIQDSASTQPQRASLCL